MITGEIDASYFISSCSLPSRDAKVQYEQNGRHVGEETDTEGDG